MTTKTKLSSTGLGHEGTNKKIKTIAELAKTVQKLKEKGQTVVLCHGVFDLMHPGHIKHLEAAKREGTVLVVTVTPDRFVNKGPGRPVFNQYLRAESLAALEVVDYTAINEWPTSIETIKTVKPNMYVKGSDYAAPEQDITGNINHEKEAVESVGGKLTFTNDITFSSTELLNKFFGVFPEETKTFIENFKKKNPSDNVISKLKDLRKMKVLVIGDTIIDEYHYCKGLGKPPKDNIICAKFISEERFAGGVLACANHLSGFCGQVDMVTCLGSTDSKEEYIREALHPNINTKFFYRNDTCTVVKRRFVDPVFLTKLFEVAFLDDNSLPENTTKEVCDYLDSVIGNYDMVLVSDFGHGFINGCIINSLLKAKFLAVNTQTNSANSGYNLITKYPRADYVCIDEPEMRLASQNKYGEMKEIIVQMAEKLKCSNVSVTRGHLGAMTYNKQQGIFETPTFTSKIVDRVGAGDAYLSITAPIVASGNSMELAGFIGNTVAAIKVGVVCNRSSVEPVPLFKFITTLLK